MWLVEPLQLAIAVEADRVEPIKYAEELPKQVATDALMTVGGAHFEKGHIRIENAVGYRSCETDDIPTGYDCNHDVSASP